jgi:hypothetical protein
MLGNWFEDRLQPVQPYEAHPEQKILREKENAINCLTSTGIPKPLASITRRPKQVTAGIIPDDGFVRKIMNASFYRERLTIRRLWTLVILR